MISAKIKAEMNTKLIVVLGTKGDESLMFYKKLTTVPPNKPTAYLGPMLWQVSCYVRCHYPIEFLLPVHAVPLLIQHPASVPGETTENCLRAWVLKHIWEP